MLDWDKDDLDTSDVKNPHPPPLPKKAPAVSALVSVWLV